MVPDIVHMQKRQHRQSNSVDSSATPSPLTSSEDSSAVNSPATPSSFSPTPSPESRSSSSASSQYSTAGFSSTNATVALSSSISSTNTRNGNSNRVTPPSPANGHINGGHSNGVGVSKPNPYPANTAPYLSTVTSQLPINLVRDQLMKCIHQNESTIIIGETGCGKTTQIPKFIYQYYGSRQQSSQATANNDSGTSARILPFAGTIGITQPRRVAATSIATRVAQEMHTPLGQLVGYTIRFEDCTTGSTRIKYMTDGILLREAITDPLLTKYRVIILDEAHERTVHTDVLFGVVKKAQRLRKLKRAAELEEGANHSNSNNNNNNTAQSQPQPRSRPLKLIIMSATMDVDHFSRYFNNAPVYYIMGRTYPIEVFYTQEKQTDYVASALSTIFQIHQQEDEIEDGDTGAGGAQSSAATTNGYAKKKPVIGGDIIVFCTGQEEIESMVKTVLDLDSQLAAFKTTTGHPKTLKPYALYAALPTAMQQRIFTRAPEDCFRRVIFATNIAETSVTIPNIRYVIDTGKVKSRTFSARTGFEVMQVEAVARAQAAQRSGRAGRLAPGQCYRLYTKKDFKRMRAFPVPEIQKCNLANVLLQLMAIGITDVANFDFVDPPPKENIDVAIESLLSLKAIERVKPVVPVVVDKSNTEPSSALPAASSHYQLTATGRQMVAFPVDPRFAALIIASKSFRCTDEILIIIAMLSVDNVFFTPADKRDLALKMHSKFASSEGDLIKLLNVYRRYKEARQSREWCNEHFVKPVQLKMAVEIRGQLAQLCDQVAIPVVACGNTEQIRRCIAVGVGVGVGLGANVAVLQRGEGYGEYRLMTVNKSDQSTTTRRTDADRVVCIHPSSCLFAGSAKPECVLFVELVHTTKSYMRNVCIIDPQWLLDYRQQQPSVEECAPTSSNQSTDLGQESSVAPGESESLLNPSLPPSVSPVPPPPPQPSQQPTSSLNTV